MEAGRERVLELVKHLEAATSRTRRRDRMSEYEAMRIHVFRDEMVMNRVQRRFETATPSPPHRSWAGTEPTSAGWKTPW